MAGASVSFSASCRPVAARTPRIDDVMGFGEPGVSLQARKYSRRRFGDPTAQEKSGVHDGTGESQANDFLALPNQENFFGCASNQSDIPNIVEAAQAPFVALGGSNASM